MSSFNARMAREVFDAHVPMVFSVARKLVRRLSDRWGMDVPPDRVEELVQDAVARAFSGFCRRCENRLPKVSERRKVLWQCTRSAAMRACVARRAFGNEAPFLGYVDAMDRRGNPDKTQSAKNGSDEERETFLQQVHYVPVSYAPQRWEIEALLNRERVPEKLRKTAVFAAMGIGQEDSGRLQGCSDRTIRNRLQELREWLNPPCTRNVYTVVVEALQEVAR